jgi:hypothetical protein
LNRNPQIVDEMLVGLFKGWPDLIELGLLGCVNLKGNEIFLEIATHCPKLEQLNVSRYATYLASIYTLGVWA